ncbi:LysR family transcriptional regulator [Parasphaerochaeta coccoides]|uniref:Transcriptional regulator, LysR family n=1 Tax=Parasphaerochaeta coccoides (strain ATCC BAA-1237 / DSM 17374 / SPN1) TaxID=760011 RepID=F4GK12_PARC1|nr:LysR family transcriptional regulator [Parasphaerochaeta coccoides]AEC01784.1 transcriptional regulator, LysR family [Parasphaerochaeta coccoides DSM 17374]
MDIRVLQYFLAVAREQSISGAAEQLNMTQPPLSRALKDMEDELGKTLFIRGNRRITLTDEGLILRKRAEEIVDLMEKAKAEVMASNEEIGGDVYFGGGESEGMRFLVGIMKQFQRDCPKIRYHIFSGNSYDVTERLDKGLIDFGVLFEPVTLSKYDNLRLPEADIWGVLMRKDAPLADLDVIRPENLRGIPLVCSKQMLDENGLSGWLGHGCEKLNVVATYNLINTPKLMVEEGIGSAICFDRLVGVPHDGDLCFRPLEPRLEAGMSLVWKKYQVFSKASKMFLNRVRAALSVAD